MGLFIACFSTLTTMVIIHEFKKDIVNHIIKNSV